MKRRKNYKFKSKEEALKARRKEETDLGRKGATVLESMSWLPLKKKHLEKQCVEVVKRRKGEYVGNGQNPFGVQNREDSGAG